MDNRKRLILTTYDATRRLHGIRASRYTLEFCVDTDHGGRVCTTVAEGWMRPQHYHVYELVDVTPAPPGVVASLEVIE